MPQKNTIIFTPDKPDSYRVKRTIGEILRSRLVIAIVSALILFLSSCKKLKAITTPPTQSELEQYFADNVLDKNFIVDLAIDNGTDITSQYSIDTFVLSKTTSYYDGPLKGTVGGTTTYTGTWTSNSDYSQLIIDLNSPSPIPSEFNFLNDIWKFTKKGNPLQLAPWIDSHPKVLHMKRV